MIIKRIIVENNELELFVWFGACLNQVCELYVVHPLKKNHEKVG